MYACLCVGQLLAHLFVGSKACSLPRFQGTVRREAEHAAYKKAKNLEGISLSSSFSLSLFLCGLEKFKKARKILWFWEFL